MIHKIAERIVAALDRRGTLKQSSRAIYVYGFDIAIYTYLSTLGLFLIGWLGGHPFETLLLIAVYYTEQSVGGGFHAASHINCFLSMVFGLVVFLLTFYLPYSLAAYMGIAIVSAILLWCFPLVLHPNKKHLAKKASQFVRRSRGILLTGITLFLIAVSLRFPSDIIQTLAMAFALAAVSRCVACVQHKELVFR